MSGYAFFRNVAKLLYYPNKALRKRKDGSTSVALERFEAYHSHVGVSELAARFRSYMTHCRHLLWYVYDRTTLYYEYECMH